MELKNKIIITAGSFDLCHAGHINILKKAKRLGNYLIVCLSTDKLIKEHKEFFPILTYEQRKKVLEAIKYVDKVVPQTKLIDIKQFKELKADIFVIGNDWKNRNDVDGLVWLIKNKKVRFIPYTKELSTTKIKNKIVKEWKLK
jgi:glycerol-3-phosphate cytidylyltransferase